MPPLPALVLTHLPSGSEVYQYPPNTPILASSVLQWLQRVEDGTESAAGEEEEDEEEVLNRTEQLNIVHFHSHAVMQNKIPLSKDKDIQKPKHKNRCINYNRKKEAVTFYMLLEY